MAFWIGIISIISLLTAIILFAFHLFNIRKIQKKEVEEFKKLLDTSWEQLQKQIIIEGIAGMKELYEKKKNEDDYN